jgi:predicted phage tail protein
MTNKQRIIVRGSGGGGGGSSGNTPREAPNNLRSRADAVILLLLGEGEIEGFSTADPLQSIYLDATPIKNSDGSLNFQNVAIDYRTGTQWQGYISGISSAVRNEIAVGTQIKQVNGPTTRTIVNPDANAVIVRVMIPTLLDQDDKGNINESSVSFRIDLSTQGGNFEPIYNETISGKTSGNYERQYRINLSTSGPWDIRITRLTPDSDRTTLQNSLFWQSLTEVIDLKLRYPNSALLGVRVSAEQFNSIPKVSVKLKQIRILVPHNYNPLSRQYSGIFDGTLIRQYSNNPAWIFYDLITNSRYGCGKYIDESLVDKFDLYAIGQYCDELVPDGKGGIEPRFTCNVYIQNQDDAFRILESLSACFRGMIYERNATITAVQDKPSNPNRIYTRANVVCEYDDDGRLTAPPFVYSGSSLDTRATVALVSWSDPANNYETAVETVEDKEGLAKFGYNSIELAAFGCTSRGQAYRLGKWTLLSQRYLTQTITFKVGAEGLLVNPGEVFKVMDSLKSVSRRGGRIKAAGINFIELDDAVIIEPGKSYNLSTVKSNGIIETKIVLNSSGIHTILYVNNWSETPRHIWILESSDLQAQLFRCTAVSEIGEHLYEIVGVEYNPSIYDLVEKSGFLLEEPDVSGFPDLLIPPSSPSALKIQESLYQTIGSGGVKTKASITWQASTSILIKEYQLEYRRDGQSQYTVIGGLQDLSTTLYDVAPGIYFFRVKAINNYGTSSSYTQQVQEIYGLSYPPSDVQNFYVNITDSYANFTWNESPDLDVRVGGKFRVKYTSKKQNTSWADGIEIAAVAGYSNYLRFPALEGTFLIKAVDSEGNQSRNVAQVVLDNISRTINYNAVETSIQHPNFNGIKTNTIVVDNQLKLASIDYFDFQTGLFDDMPGLFDDVAGYFDSTEGDFDFQPGMFDDLGILYAIYPSGYYDFDAPIDLGDIFDSRCTANFSGRAIDESRFFDRVGGLFDNYLGFFDGEDIDNASAILQISVSQDGINYNEYQNFVTGNYKGRAFKFRVFLQSSEVKNNFAISELSVTVDMPDTILSGNTQTSNLIDTIVSFSKKFREVPEIGLTLQDGLSGDYIKLESKTTSGFVINARNNLNNRIIRTISWIAKGY